MSLLSRLTHTLKLTRSPRLDPPISDRDPHLAQLVKLIADHNAPLWPRLDMYNAQADEYTRSSWLYVAVTRIAEAAAMVPINTYRMDGGKRIAMPDHPLERLLRAPNPTLSQFELLEATFGFLELHGNAYWYLAGDGAPSEIWPLRPDRVRIVPDRTHYVGAYVYMLDGVEIPLHPDEVIHFKRWHPKDDYFGLSALEAAAMASQTDRAMANWNRNFFDVGKAIPAGILTIKSMVSDADFERIKREWLESYGGTQRKTAFIRGTGEIGWQNLGLSQQESDFLEARRLNRDEVFQIFGLPLGLYDKNATQANATVARQTFLSDTIYPKLTRFTQKLTLQLAPFWGSDLLVMPDDVRGNEADLAEVQAARAFMTINEVRARYFNLEAVAWGDASAETIPVMPSPHNAGQGI